MWAGKAHGQSMDAVNAVETARLRALRIAKETADKSAAVFRERQFQSSGRLVSTLVGPSRASRPDNMPVSSATGYVVLGSIRARSVRIHCGGPRLR